MRESRVSGRLVEACPCTIALAIRPAEDAHQRLAWA